MNSPFISSQFVSTIFPKLPKFIWLVGYKTWATLLEATHSRKKKEKTSFYKYQQVKTKKELQLMNELFNAHKQEKGQKKGKGERREKNKERKNTEMKGDWVALSWGYRVCPIAIARKGKFSYGKFIVFLSRGNSYT